MNIFYNKEYDKYSMKHLFLFHAGEVVLLNEESVSK